MTETIIIRSQLICEIADEGAVRLDFICLKTSTFSAASRYLSGFIVSLVLQNLPTFIFDKSLCSRAILPVCEQAH